MSDIFVITCPGGKQCSHLIPLLYNKVQLKLRLAAHSEASADGLRTKYPDAEIMSVDLASLADCRRLLQGATAINAVLPSLHSHEKEMGLNLVDAAVAETQRQGSVFKHFVLSSVLCTQHRSLLQHDLKSYVEERLFLSPLNWTILKPTNVSTTEVRFARRAHPLTMPIPIQVLGRLSGDQARGTGETDSRDPVEPRAREQHHRPPGSS